ncbi:prepilin-type N-terminal cleavage/methylation domain-containing protein [Paenibacillus sp. L3-i20]|uniref:type IV pilus modification PilV family protein n=1 Tax=Paenibacillus sp. L3-i20 TaxID=2905833 RepID=UPI001EDF29BC|nr:prepilin-type N-terminal cleavage/methylation domain-containing protein [Paenibacillus sp. L3-i20]GKU79899.1 hypothetical protein L3i20_v242960 [Paenibacillus sp. L3-i20]
MNNQKGLTLVEVLGTVVLLGIAILAITFVLQQSTIHSKDNEQQDRSVQITRSVLEEIKNNSRLGTATIFDQNVNLSPSSSTVQSIQYPKVNPKYTISISISNSTFNDLTIAKTGGDLIIPLKNIFKLVNVTSANKETGKQFTLKAYVEFS